MRPVRLAPWAAGARPRISNRAWSSPNPGTGLPQYSHSRYARRLSRATFSRYFTRRGHLRQATISSFRTLSRDDVSGIGLIGAPLHQAIQFGVGNGSSEHHLARPGFQHVFTDSANEAQSGAHDAGTGADPGHADFFEFGDGRAGRIG